MRDWGKIRARFWCDEQIELLPDRPKLLACYLMTTQHGNALGCFRLPLAYAADDLKRDPALIAEDFKLLSDVGFVYRDDKTGWTLILNHLKHNEPENPKVGIACAKAAGQAPDSLAFLEKLLAAVTAYPKHLPGSLSTTIRNRIETVSKNRSDTVSQLSRIPNHNHSPILEPEPKPSAADAASADAPTQLPVIDPKRIIFGECLAWIAKAENKPPEKLRSLLGQWCRDFGNADVIDAFQAAARDPPAGSAVEWLVAFLQTRSGQRGRNRKAQLGGTMLGGILEGCEAAGTE